MQINNPKQIGIFIRALRKQLNIAQKDLALTSGTGLRFIVDLEKGKPTCHIGKVLAVLQSLGVKIEAIPPTEFNREGV